MVMNKPILATLLLSFVLLVCCSHATPAIQKVVIRDNTFEIVKTIDDAALLNEANVHWNNLVPMDDLPRTTWTHKIDIEEKQIGGRWLYNSENGYLALLNPTLKPCYQVSDIKKFNELFLTK